MLVGTLLFLTSTSAAALNVSSTNAAAAVAISISSAGATHVFDGHGGLSAGASSRLLKDYVEPSRTQILDYLWKPNFGASLQICKIEVGGDTQSTDGTEPSHRHFREETPACSQDRGYELWLLAEAKARNPDVKSYILSWGVPAWIGNGSYFSQDNIDYQVSYAQCVKETVGSGPDYIGIWNERSWGSIDYVVSLRKALDASNFTDTKIVLPDGGDCEAVVAAAKSNATFAAAVYALGEHYPCKRSCPELADPDVDIKFWSSEDQSTVADWAGAGCWGRSLLQNYVLLNATATISWSTIWSVYPAFSYFGNGLMYAYEPWSGNYTVNPTIWTSAQWTQFIAVGDTLLAAPEGSGMLPLGGSYVSSVSSSSSSQTAAAAAKTFTLVLESLEGECLRCKVGPVPPQDLTFTFTPGGGVPGAGTMLYVWLSNEAAQFVFINTIVIAPDNTINFHLPSDSMVTISTSTGSAAHGTTPPAPPSTPFPLPYSDDFNDANYDSLPRYFTDQAGVLAVRHGLAQQVVPADPGPNGWVRNGAPVSMVGDANWTDVIASLHVSFDSATADRGDNAPPLPSPPTSTADTLAAHVTPCVPSLPKNQAWDFGLAAADYLSSRFQPFAYCLNANGCATDLVYYQCITSGGTCGGVNNYDNLKFQLNAETGKLISAMDGQCVTVASDNTLSLLPCTTTTTTTTSTTASTVWNYTASTGQLSTIVSQQQQVCLTVDVSPPYARLCIRSTGNFQTGGYCLTLDTDGMWTVAAASQQLASGYLSPPGFNSTNGVQLSVAAKGTNITVSIDSNVIWSGIDSTQKKGMVSIGSGYHRAAWDNFLVTKA